MTGGALNARLLSAAEFVRQDATFADVGTDHAYLPLFLLEGGRISYAYCSDINEGPLASAKRNAEARGMLDRMDFILTDGAAVLGGRGITDYAICGMGGELIADIIAAAPHLMDGSVNLILQPMTRQPYLRRFLAEHGFLIRQESYSYDAGKYYVCMQVEYVGGSVEIGDVESEIGSNSCRFIGDAARLGYINGILSARKKALEGKKIGGIDTATDEKVIEALEALVLQLKEG